MPTVAVGAGDAAGGRPREQAARGEPNDEEYAPDTRNGRATERLILCGTGAVKVEAPRVNERWVDEASNRKRFKSVILPP